MLDTTLFPLWALLIMIFTIHYIADFWIQTEHQAISKSESLLPLAKHCISYSLPFLLFGPLFALFTGVLHFITDLWTSKATSYYFSHNQTRKGFQVVGFDQLIHNICLIVGAVIFL